MFLQENNLRNVVLVCLGHHCTKQLRTQCRQCWPTVHSLVNVVQIRLRQHCTRKLLVQYWHSWHSHLFAGKYHIQCCLNLPEPTLHKKITCEMLVHSLQTTLHRKVILNFVGIYLGQHCIRKCPCLRDNSYEENNLYNVVSTMPGQHCIRILSSQFCPNRSAETTLHKKITCALLARAHRYTFTGKPAVSNMFGSLFFNWVHYHRTILALFVQCWLGNSFTAWGTTQWTGAGFEWDKCIEFRWICRPPDE